ncbi:sensor histidine kinase [Candidatus Lokiarchaeum ossiferum]|uniref:sensor histidine kinase n=1 Tax=Candidatus Lokiarchaeum ossiferum TaxID=2951803 RepID=UPI00352F608E
MNETKANHEIVQKVLDSEKFILLGKMASGVAHEINNPVMIIQNYISLILEDIQDHGSLTLTSASEHYDSLQEILSECQRVAKITKNLLDFSRPSSKTPKSCNLEEILLGVLKLMDPIIIKSQIQIRMESEAKYSHSFVRRDEIQQVFMNILDNAIYSLRKKYTDTQYNEDKKLVKIKIRNEVISHGSMEKTYVVIDFHDDGLGVSAKISDQIFNPFFTTKKTKEILPEDEKYQGLGLGLSYCQTILDVYEGFLKFESEENQFACFHVYLLADQTQIPEAIGENDLVTF